MACPSSLKAMALAMLAVLPAAPLTAEQSMIQDTGVANRLVVGEVLRALSQEIPAAACHLHHGVNVTDATDNLTYGLAQVDELLDALTQGDIFWGIEFPEERRKTLAEIESLRSAWAPLQDAGNALLSNPADAAANDQLAGAADIMLDQTYRLLTTLDGQYTSSAEILQRDVMFIQLSGRMAALNQHLALEACILWSEGPDAEVAADMIQTADMYHNSLNALTNGLSAMGILPPQTPGIADKLAEIEQMWLINKPALMGLADGQALTADAKHDLYYNMIDERVVLLDLVYLYQDHSKVH